MEDFFYLFFFALDIVQRGKQHQQLDKQCCRSQGINVKALENNDEVSLVVSPVERINTASICLRHIWFFKLVAGKGL